MPSLGDFTVAKKETPDREPDTFTFCGELFTVAEQVGIVAWGRFAQAAQAGHDTAEMEGLAALIEVVSQIVVDADRDRFLTVASRNRADADDLLAIVRAVMEAQAERPTQQPSDSSAGLSPTPENSKAPSFSAESLSPIQRDPRIVALVPVEEAGREFLVG